VERRRESEEHTEERERLLECARTDSRH